MFKSYYGFTGNPNQINATMADIPSEHASNVRFDLEQSSIASLLLPDDTSSFTLEKSFHYLKESRHSKSFFAVACLVAEGPTKSGIGQLYMCEILQFQSSAPRQKCSCHRQT